VVAVNVTGAGDRAKKNATKIKLQDMKNQLGTYYTQLNGYPPDLNVLVKEKFIEANKDKDAWDTPLIYDPRGRNADQPFILSSAGPNKVVGDDDDMSVWELK
jgi:hypothetical protein